MQTLLATVADVPLKECLEVISIYRCCPVPDIDPFGVAQSYLNLHREPHSAYVMTNQLRAFGVSYEGFMKHRKKEYIRNFNKLYQFCPGKLIDELEEDAPPWTRKFPLINPGEIINEEIDDIDIHASCQYVQR